MKDEVIHHYNHLSAFGPCYYFRLRSNQRRALFRLGEIHSIYLSKEGGIVKTYTGCKYEVMDIHAELVTKEGECFTR